ncbi:MAG: hypothetical protein ACRDRZ_08350 [Pseudonocardiaceae bacterium]
MAELDDRRRAPDMLTLLVGIGALVVAVTALAGTSWLPAVDARWLLAGGAATIGLLLLAGSVRPRRDRR